MELEKQYIPQRYEEKIYAEWEARKFYKIDIKKDNKPFSIVMPPPNITGRLHIGHAMNNSIQDILIRFHRLLGENSLWIPGMDHAGIATHTVVEKKIAKEKGITRWELGREKFVAEVWKWKEEYGDVILKQLRRTLALPDWSRKRFTLDDGLSNAVYKVFETLFNEGLIYRGDYIVNWCPRCHTALADTEVEYKEENGHLWYIKYPLKEEAAGIKYLVVATTRPETMLGDTAVAVHSKDKRYKKLVGRTVILPLQNKEIPIISDKLVDMNFGTGVVKVTPFHDPKDNEMGIRHNLELVKVIDEDGMMMGDIPDIFLNLSREDARTVAVDELQKLGLIEKIDDFTHSVSTCYRCHTTLEPLVSRQWFVKMKSLAEPAINAVENGEIRFYPEKWKNYYLNWMYNIRDWCISRQLWWGHRIPVFYCMDCDHTYVSKKKSEKCPKCGSTNIKQDEDVLDTWFSSALWPFSTMGWPEKTELLDKYYPTSVLVTDRGIIFNWVARMIMMGLKFIGKKPFDDVYIHGTILDDQGRKMSKSLGNGIDPIEMADKYGADAMRFSLLSLTTFGQDIYLSENKFQMGRNFANKIWNAFRYILLNTKDNENYQNRFIVTNGFDRWILSRYGNLRLNAENFLKNYHFSEYAHLLYHFFWNDFCDWYVESTKNRLARSTTIENLFYIGSRFLILLHPIMPVITEVLYSYLPKNFKQQEMILNELMPKEADDKIDNKYEQDIEEVLNWITSIRRARKEFDIKQSTKITVLVKAKNKIVENIIRELKDEISEFINAKILKIGDFESEKKSINIITTSITSSIPAENIIDIEKEKKRLEEQKEKITKFIDVNTKKLDNKMFIKKAPRDVIDKAKENIEKNKGLLEQVEKNLEGLK